MSEPQRGGEANVDEVVYDAGIYRARNAGQAGLDNLTDERVRPLASAEPHSPSTFRFES